MRRFHKAIVALFTGISFTTLSLMTYPVQASATATGKSSPWSGYWFGTTRPTDFFFDNATKKTVDFESPFTGQNGQAHIHGNVAALTTKYYYISFTGLSNGSLRVVYQKENDPKSRIVETFVRNLFQSVTLSVPKKDTALFIGKTYFAPGTVLELDVAPADDKYTDLICWETTVGPHGQIHSENDISWMKGGRLDIRGYVSEMDRQNVSFVTSMATNTVQTTIAHRRIAKDARRFYRPGTPAYSVADYVYKNPVVNLPKWDNSQWYLQGIGIYHLTDMSKTSALAYTRLQIGTLPHPRPGKEGRKNLLYYTFKVNKKDGAWIVNASNLTTMVYREGNTNINYDNQLWAE